MSLVNKIYKLFVFVGFTALTVLLINYWLATKQYVFTEEDVARIAKQYAGEFDNTCKAAVTTCHSYLTPDVINFLVSAVGQDHEQAFSKIVVELRKRSNIILHNTNRIRVCVFLFLKPDKQKDTLRGMAL